MKPNKIIYIKSIEEQICDKIRFKLKRTGLGRIVRLYGKKSEQDKLESSYEK